MTDNNETLKKMTVRYWADLPGDVALHLQKAVEKSGMTASKMIAKCIKFALEHMEKES